MGGYGAVDPDCRCRSDVQGEDLAVDTRSGGGDWSAEECFGVGWRTWSGEGGLRDGVLGAVEMEFDGVADSGSNVVGSETQVSICV